VDVRLELLDRHLVVGFVRSPVLSFGLFRLRDRQFLGRNPFVRTHTAAQPDDFRRVSGPASGGKGGLK